MPTSRQTSPGDPSGGEQHDHEAGSGHPGGADSERAARLLGAATAIGSIGDADVNAQLEEQFFAPARDRTRDWSHAYTAGAQMSFEEGIAFALTPARTPG